MCNTGKYYETSNTPYCRTTACFSGQACDAGTCRSCGWTQYVCETLCGGTFTGISGRHGRCDLGGGAVVADPSLGCSDSLQECTTCGGCWDVDYCDLSGPCVTTTPTTTTSTTTTTTIPQCTWLTLTPSSGAPSYTVTADVASNTCKVCDSAGCDTSDPSNCLSVQKTVVSCN